MRFVVSAHGRALATRPRGKELRELARSAGARDLLVLDFQDVSHVSYSFVDEFVGQMVADTTVPVRIENAAPEVLDLVCRSLARRDLSAGAVGLSLA